MRWQTLQDEHPETVIFTRTSVNRTSKPTNNPGQTGLEVYSLILYRVFLTEQSLQHEQWSINTVLLTLAATCSTQL